MGHRKFNKKRWGRFPLEKHQRASSEGQTIPKIIPAEAQLECSSPKAIIYKSEMDFISRCILDYKNIETGGELFGFWTVTGTPVVLYAIGPGPRANHQSTFFNQDTDYLNSIGSQIVNHFGLHHIGEWHSHHQLGLAHPSGHDASTMINSIRTNNLHRFLCCIGNCTDEYSTLNAFNFTGAEQYSQAEWIIKPIESPFRHEIDNYLGDQVIQPRTVSASYRSSIVRNTPQMATQPLYPSGYWLNEKENRLVLKEILDFVVQRNPESECSVNMDSDHLVHILTEKDSYKEDICFGMDFPKSAPAINRISDDRPQKVVCPEWFWTNDVFASFAYFYSNIHSL